MPLTCTFPPGSYFVGDICHVYPIDMKEHTCDTEYCTRKGQPIALCHVYQGNGTYYSEEGNVFPVLHNNIAVVSLQMSDRVIEDLARVGQVICSQGPVFVHSKDGHIHIRYGSNDTITLLTDDVFACMSRAKLIQECQALRATISKLHAQIREDQMEEL